MAGPATGAGQLQGPGPREKTTGTVLRLCVHNVAQGPTHSRRNAGLSTKNATIVGDLDTLQRCVDKIQTIEPARLRSTTQTQRNSLQTTLRVTKQKHQLSASRPHAQQGHIRPLWVAQSQESHVSQTDCEVNTGVGCNILPIHKAQQLFGQE